MSSSRVLHFLAAALRRLYCRAAVASGFFIHETSCGFLIKGFDGVGGYPVEHFSEFCVDLGDLHLKVNAVILAFLSLQAHADMQLQRSQHLCILVGCFHDRRHHSPLQYAFLYGWRVVTVFLGVFNAVDASPYNFLFAACRPCASAVGGLAFTADEQFCQSVFT
mgnify:CR=1 FL=1